MSDQKLYPTEYSDEVLDVLYDMCFGDDIQLLGSGSQSSSLYAGDYDAHEDVRRKGETEDVLVELRRDFQNIILKLKSRRDVRIGDIKAGEIPEWRILSVSAGVEDGKVVGYNHNDAHQRIDKLVELKVLTEKEAEEAYKLTPANISPEGIIKAISELKFHIMRWTPAEVLNNKKGLVNGEVFTLEQAFRSPAITKLDTIAFLQGNRFVEFSIIYTFHNGKIILNPIHADIERSLLESIIAYHSEGKDFKVLKRIASLGRLHKKWDLVEKITPIFNGDLGRMNLVSNDIQTLLFMFENYKSLPESAIRFEIDQFIHRLSNVYETPEFEKHSLNIFRDLHRAVKMPLKSMPTLLGKIAEKLDSIIQTKAKPIVDSLISK